MLYILMFYRWKYFKDQKADQLAEEYANFSEEEKVEADRNSKLRDILKRIIFRVYMYLLEDQQSPVIFIEYLIKVYPGGDEYENSHEFLHNIIGACEHPYRSNDLNFRVRMINHHKQIKQFVDTLVKRIYPGEKVKNVHDAISILKVLAAPNNVAYSLVQDSLYCDLDDEIRNKRTFICKYFFRYRDSKILIEKLGTGGKEIIPIEEYDTLPEQDKAYIIDYMSLMAILAE